MPCYHTKSAWVAYEEPNGKKHVVFKKQSDNPYEINDLIQNENKLSIPCGSCIGCRLDYAKTWAGRCAIEMLDKSENYFITLTYNDSNLTWGKDSPTLVREDLSQFLKKFRERRREKHGTTDIRFFGCGEYGPKHQRPHYHLMLFGVEGLREELVFDRPNGTAPIYWSQEIEEAWGKGLITVQTANIATAAYTAKYMLKKAKGADRELNPSRQEEFVNASRMPGIAGKYYTEHMEQILADKGVIIVPDSEKGSREIRVEGYFKKLVEKEGNEEYKKQLQEIAREHRRDALEGIREKLKEHKGMTMRQLETYEEEITARRIAKAQRKYETDGTL